MKLEKKFTEWQKRRAKKCHAHTHMDEIPISMNIFTGCISHVCFYVNKCYVNYGIFRFSSFVVFFLHSDFISYYSISVMMNTANLTQSISIMYHIIQCVCVCVCASLSVLWKRYKYKCFFFPTHILCNDKITNEIHTQREREKRQHRQLSL